MGEKPDFFPSFPELCATARDIEKRAIAVSPSQIDGRLALDGNSGIFPREFEDYTYSFLLFEAQKVERKLFAETIASAPSRIQVPSAPPTPEKQMQEELHKFVVAQGGVEGVEGEPEGVPPEVLEARKRKQTWVPEQAGAKDQGEKKGEEAQQEEEPPQSPSKGKIFPPRIFPGRQKEEGQIRAKEEGVPIEEKEIPKPSPERGDKQGKEVEKILPPATSPPEKSDETPPAIPKQTGPLGTRNPKIPIFPPSPPQDQGEATGQPGSQSQQKEGTPTDSKKQEDALPKPPGMSSYSKLSPRLQALIEAKLRREEEKAKQKGTDSEIFKTPQPLLVENGRANEQSEEEGRALGRTFPPMQKEGENEGPARPEPGDGGSLQEAKQEQANSESPLVPEVDESLETSKFEGESEPPLPGEDSLGTKEGKEKMPPGEGGLQEKTEEAPMPPEKTEGKQDGKRAFDDEKGEPLAPSQPAPLTISPIFTDSPDIGMQKQAGGSASSEESDRMKRIQRIIGELSDKPREQSKQLPEPAEASFENDEEPVMEEGEKEAPIKTTGKQVEKKPTKKEIALMKKSAALAAKEKKKAEKEAAKNKVKIAADGKAASKGKIAFQKKPGEEKRMGQAAKSEGKKEQPLPKPTDSAGSKTAVPKAGRGTKEMPVEVPKERISAKGQPQQEQREQIVPGARMETEPEREIPDEAISKQPMPSKKLFQRISPSQEKEEVPQEDMVAQEEEAMQPRRQMPQKLVPRIPLREEESKEEEQAPMIPLRRRILPGMVRTEPEEPTTYVPPARGRVQIAIPESDLQQGKAGEDGGAKPVSSSFAPLRPRKIVSDEPVPPVEKTPQQSLMEQKKAKMEEYLARIEASKTKEVSGTADLPDEKDEEIPLPEDSPPNKEDYAAAKEGLRRSLEHEETAHKVKLEEESIVEQYAKEHVVWLYEIYKMGGMSREDFIKKATEKYSESKGGQAQGAAEAEPEAPPNPALANLSKVIEKKDNK